MAEFKKISDTEVVEAPAESDNLLLVSEGAVKQVPVTAVGGGNKGAEPIYLIPINKPEAYTNISEYLGDYQLEDGTTFEYGSPITNGLYDQYIAGTPIYIKLEDTRNNKYLMQCIGAGLGDGNCFVSLAFFDMIGREYKLVIMD